MTTFYVSLRPGATFKKFTPFKTYKACVDPVSVGSRVYATVFDDEGQERVIAREDLQACFVNVDETPDQRADEPALRYDGGKSRIDLIDPGFILRLGDHYGVGAQKYAERNWQKGMSYSRCYGSAQRHMLAFWGGEDVDAETGSRHVIAAAWNMAAIDFYMSDPELEKKFDDRPKKPA